jgi:hypothetical protein
MGVAVGAELFEFQAPRRFATIFLSGIPRDPWRSFVRVSAALGTFQGDDNANALSHNFSAF